MGKVAPIGRGRKKEMAFKQVPWDEDIQDREEQRRLKRDAANDGFEKHALLL